ncbi:MAG: glycosyltransferase family 4 protein [Bacteroidales bacterium]|nr:glycosyltransferase family 4 protein [Bacteroidales bacterium]
MRILFFQNCVSPHQMPYIEVLAQRHDVVVVVPFISYEAREMMGWGKYETTSPVRMIISPTDEEVQNLFEEPYEGRTVALFSGISAFRDVKPWFLVSLDYDVERGIITEAPFTFKYPLWMHRIRFWIQDYKFVKYIKYVFAIGAGCKEYYQSLSDRWKIVPFAYCVSDREQAGDKVLLPVDKANFCFVGSLDKRKNVIALLKAFDIFKHKHRSAAEQCHITIVGDGPKRQMLETYVSDNGLTDQITFLGTLSMSAARQIIAQSNVLVLPSLYDGWGAVVNEALTEGTMVYCSSACGASMLLTDSSRGRVFGSSDYQGLAKLFWNDYGFFLDKDKTAHRREALKKWAIENIGPEAMAKRMEEGLRSRKKQ